MGSYAAMLIHTYIIHVYIFYRYTQTTILYFNGSYRLRGVLCMHYCNVHSWIDSLYFREHNVEHSTYIYAYILATIMTGVGKKSSAVLWTSTASTCTYVCMRKWVLFYEQFKAMSINNLHVYVCICVCACNAIFYKFENIPSD